MKIFCSGIGGIGLSAYAFHMNARGHIVAGSDKTNSALIGELIKENVAVTLQQDGSAINKSYDLLVYSEAIPSTSPERQKALALGIPQQSYFQALGELSKTGRVVAICGTHGKSSTTAMLAKILVDAGKDPNIVVGTKCKDLHGKNWRKGNSDLWIIEACEYRRSFLHLCPSVIIITNIDGDHYDAFSNLSDYHNAFYEFCSKLPKDGTIIVHGNDQQVQKMLEGLGRPVLDSDDGPLPLIGIPGQHMRENGSLALKASHVLEVNEQRALQSLETFSGTWRRMELKGKTKQGCILFDDYAHHPKEIRATLSALREVYDARRILCVYQPHTHDRTKKLWNEFCESFNDADVIIIPNIYDARPDIEDGAVNIPLFVQGIAEKSEVECLDGKGFEETKNILDKYISARDDIVVVMGAGDIGDLAEELVQ